MQRPTEQERQALRQRYSQPVKKVGQVFKVYNCGQVVFTGDVRLCWGFIHQWNLKTKPTLK